MRKIIFILIFAITGWSFFVICYFLEFGSTRQSVVLSERELRENCRLLGVITRSPSMQSYYEEILQTFKDPRYSQHSGWSLSIFSDYYSSGKLGIPGEPLIIRSDINVEDDLDLFNNVAKLAIRLKPNCLIGHLRNASSGCNEIADPHPFQAEHKGKQYLFIHNGGVWGDDLSYLANELLGGGADPKTCPGNPIDSELLFLYLLKIMDDRNADPFTAGKIWGKTLLAGLQNEWNALNFILTDGESLWALRSSYSESGFLLNLHEFGDGQAYAISTEALSYGWQSFPNNSICELKIGMPPRFEMLPETPAVTPQPSDVRIIS